MEDQSATAPLANSVTELLSAWGEGDRAALDQLTDMLYDELRRLAQRQLRDWSANTLGPTALVNEAWLRLAGSGPHTFEGRAHFLFFAARIIRNILVDHARARKAARRGGGGLMINVDDIQWARNEKPVDFVALNDAMDALNKLDPRKAQLLELRFFGGLTGEEMAACTGISTATVTRELRMAQAWLHREMAGPEAP